MGKLLSRRKPAIWTLIAAVASCGIIIQQRAVAGFFGFHRSGAHLATVEIRLQENFQATSVAWSADGRFIAAGSTADPRIDIWDLPQRKVVKTLLRKFPPAYFHDISWSPNGRYLAFCDAGVLAVYRTSDWSEVHTFKGPNGDAGCTQSAFSSDSRRVALLGTHFLGVYSVPDWKTLRSVNLWSGWGRADLFNALSYLPQNDTLLVAGGQYVTHTYYGRKQGTWDGRIWIFRPYEQQPGRSIRTYRPGCDHGGGGDVRDITVNPNGQYIVTGANTGAGDESCGITSESIHVVRVSDGQTLAAPLDGLRPTEYGGGIAAAYTHDGRYIVVPHAGKVGWIHVLDGKTFKVIDLVRANAFPCDAAVNLVDDRFALAAGDQIIVWLLPNS